MIAGIVLAAGRSRRMGRPKAFLRLDGRTFLERAVSALRDGGCGEVVVVVGPPEDETARAVAESALALGARLAVNPEPESEQIDSLRAGILALPRRAGVAIVLPVDVPGATAELVVALVDGFRANDALIVRPSAGGRSGHPVLFARPVWRDLLREELPEGARTVIHEHAARVHEVPVPALPEDVDTPDDYRRLAGLDA
ncbi:MAG TPA: nucleotidyltransferase family protein [Longimicrobium sp.]|nr:nucleotidyltransferase family protein [Longimicrobium sp.]